MVTRTFLMVAASSVLLVVGMAGGFAQTTTPKAKAKAPPAATTTAPDAAKPDATAAVFPKGIDPKYAKEKAGTARLHTCTDQYNANKATNANGGLKWIQKGGGYWSECDKRLKGTA
jgi:hypothetical protein